MEHTPNKGKSSPVAIWLLIGVVMVFVQIILGGITRLTGSGLSITRWDIVMGTLPPMNPAAWGTAFDLYKQTPQYQHINQGMELAQFKFIYFWEYFHRLWARSMGFVFVIPFLYFLKKGQLQKATLRRLGVVIGIASLAAVFGWIMVASGLINRPWVNAYKLTIHLSLGISLFVFLTYTWMKERGIQTIDVTLSWSRMLRLLVVLTIIQICFGGFVSGMKSALQYPTWPDMNGAWIPAIIWDTSHWNTQSLLMYDQSGFMPTLVQVIHRNLAYLLALLVVGFAVQWIRHQSREYQWIGYTLLGIIVVQVMLGILVLLNSKGSIPVSYGSLHQAIGILLITMLMYMSVRMKVR